VSSSLAGIQIFFPDPWPKARHHKRRLIQPDFVRLLVDKLKPGGFLHLATDWEAYAAHMYSVLSNEPRLTNQASASGFVSRAETRPVTKFEKRGLKLGHKIWDLQFINSNSG
jgi:tRNA (guanine-N7-)-methyltransferase